MKVAREVARVLIFDEQKRLLLLNGRDSSKPTSPCWWFTVGGGVKSNETLVGAARREAFEETGLLLERVLPTPFSHFSNFSFEDRIYFQHETYFAAQVHTFEFRPQGLSRIEARSIIGHRWWSLSELEHATDTIYPAPLPGWVEYMARSLPFAR